MLEKLSFCCVWFYFNSIFKQEEKIKFCDPIKEKFQLLLSLLPYNLV